MPSSYRPAWKAAADRAPHAHDRRSGSPTRSASVLAWRAKSPWLSGFLLARAIVVRARSGVPSRVSSRARSIQALTVALSGKTFHIPPRIDAWNARSLYALAVVAE